jgi:PKD repeat protein
MHLCNIKNRKTKKPKNMKKTLFTLTLMLIAIFAINAQTQTLLISGYVTEAQTGLAVNNHEVYISGDSSNSSGNVYWGNVFTNNNGYYADTVNVLPGTQGLFYVSTADCNGNYLTSTVVSTNLPMTANFSICIDTVITINCQAYFNHYADTSNTSGTASTNIHFFDASTGNVITSWNWSFGDGTSSASQNPVHFYQAPGLYTVCLAITTSTGCNSTYCDSIYVAVNPPVNCQADFYAYPDSAQYGYSFYNYSSGTSNTTNYLWNFGDGSSSTLEYPNHTYSGTGAYNVCLTISGDSCQDSYCSVVTVGNDTSTTGCIADFYYYSDSINYLGYQFINSNTGFPQGGIYAWDFGDGTSSNLVNPYHVYSTPGIYPVCLYISDSILTVVLCSYCDSVVVDSSNTPGCQAYFYTYPDSTNGNTLYFADYSSGNPTNWLWNFGDGTSSSLQYPSHLFGPGQHYVCLTTTSPLGCTSTYCDYVQVNSTDSTYCNLSVIANSIVNESFPGAADGSINIDVFGGTPPYNYSWSNGATTQNISGLTPGYYNVVVTDNSGLQGCQTWATFEIMNQADSSNWNYNDTLVTNPVDTCFNFQIGNAYIYNYYFINNNTMAITWIVYDTQGISYSFVTVTCTFGSNGFYTVPLTISCGSSKNVYQFYDQLHIMSQAVGINSINASDDNITVFPNPVVDNLNVSINISASAKATISILNAIGQIIYTENAVCESGQKTITINTSSLSKGFYFVQLNYNGQTITNRFVK